MKIVSTHTVLTVATRGKGLYACTDGVQRFVHEQKLHSGVCTVFVQHTSCSLVIQENADPDVQHDLADYFERLVPEDDPSYRHTLEGPDDMTSHVRATLTGASLTIPIVAGQLALGTWQALYVFEHRRGPHQRNVVVQVIGAAHDQD